MCPTAPGRGGADHFSDAAAVALSSGGTDHVLRNVLSGTTAGVAILDPQLRYLYVNPAFARTIGVPATSLLGRTINEVLPGIESRSDVLEQVLLDGLPREATTTGVTHTDASGAPGQRRWWHGAYHRLEIGGEVFGIAGIVVEVTASQEQQRALEQAQARLTLLDAAATRIGTTLDMDTTSGELAEFLVPLLGDVATVEVFPEETGQVRGVTASGGLRLRRSALASLPELREATRQLGLTGEYVDYPAGSAVPRCLATERPIMRNLQSEEELTQWVASPERLAAYRAVGIHSTLVVPLAARGHTIGTVSLARAGDSPAFTDEDVVNTQDLSGRAAITIDNARRYTRSQGIALELQRALLAEPGSPHPNVELASRYLPSGSSALVGGDWFETVRLPFGRTLLVMGDVMGHGVEAAVDMSNYRSMIRYVSASDLPPHRILRQLDTNISEGETGRPATCLLALVDPARGICSYSSAGHLPPAVLGADGRPQLVEVPPGPPLGTGFGGYDMVTREFGTGEVLILYTDGLVERRDEDIDRSLARLTRLRLPVAGTLDALLDQVLRHLTDRVAEDDVAVLAARVRPPSAAGPGAASRAAPGPPGPGPGGAPGAPGGGS
ncbi:SpoIIE family protein phosphatase [Streptomyces sp. bgisy100]|uniref:PP2C family protein-serine/threonine phosphatase n=1 Tax=Streptomyces sp. bgisy100 TaxID=3413783 RepID=UPI003D71477E